MSFQILRLDCKEMGANVPWNWKLTVPKITEMVLGQTIDDQSENSC